MEDLIRKEDVLKLIEDIKCDNSIPKNYGTLLDIMRAIRKIPSHNKWISVSEQFPKACYKSGNSEEVLITLGWFYNNGEFREVDDEQYIGYFNEGLYNDYLECDEDERLEMEEILNDCWNVYEKGQRVTVDLTTNRKVIAWQSLPESYKE